MTDLSVGVCCPEQEPTCTAEGPQGPKRSPVAPHCPRARGVRHFAEMAGCVVLETATTQALSLRPLPITETAFSKAPGEPDPFAGGSGSQPTGYNWQLRECVRTGIPRARKPEVLRAARVAGMPREIGETVTGRKGF